MSLEVVQGESRYRSAANSLAKKLRTVVSQGTLYLGYPVLSTADENVNVDALLVSREHGLVAFLIGESPQDQSELDFAIEEQDRLFAVLQSHLGRHEALRTGRKVAVEPQTATLYPSRLIEGLSIEKSEGYLGSVEGLDEWLDTRPKIEENIERALQASLQRVNNIKPRKKRESVRDQDSRGAKLKTIEKGIANLDQWQKQAAIESPEGPQRIRGLAGSGKTVVLALKASYLHVQHPEWKIALTFHSRALYQQIDDLVTRFTFEHNNDRPTPNLKIIHSWGSSHRAGVYSMMANAIGETARDWNYARATYGYDGAFAGVCRELLSIVEVREVEPIFDAILIDEAQDLPSEFFRLVYRFTKFPKRIVWGYDELQKLSEAAMPTTDELFGLGKDGETLISLDASEDEPRRDIVLPVCYRNTPWALATAHALGLGIYRAEGLLQHPDEPTLWKDIGYNIIAGDLVEGTQVALQRRKDSYPDYFVDLLDPEDAVLVEQFADRQVQDRWVAGEIEKNLNEDELEHDDILIVLPDSYRAKSRAPKLMAELRSKGISSHLVGVNTSVDEVFRPNSIAIAHIFRAKGNEAPMVYVIDADETASDNNAVTQRNKLFTAITRSRAWVRITGYGEAMERIREEIREVARKDYQLRFRIPTQDELAELRHIHRERSEVERKTLQKATSGLSFFFDALERGNIDISDLPPQLRTRLAVCLGGETDDDDPQ